MADMQSEPEYLDIDRYCDGRHRGKPVQETDERWRLEIYHVESMEVTVGVILNLSRKGAYDRARIIYPMDDGVGSPTSRSP